MKRQWESGQELGRQDVAGFGRALERPVETLAVAPVDTHDVELGIDSCILATP